MFSRLILIAIITVIALRTAHARQQETLRVTVQDSITSAPLGGANVHLIQNGQVIATSVTTDNGVASFSLTIVSTENVPPFSFQLGTPYPNPAFDRTAIPLKLDRPGKLDVEFYDLLGRRVAAYSSAMKVGTYEIYAVTSVVWRLARTSQESPQKAVPFLAEWFERDSEGQRH